MLWRHQREKSGPVDRRTGQYQLIAQLLHLNDARLQQQQAEANRAQAARDLQVLYTLGSELAEGKRWPNWDAGSEFRGARDASADQRK